MVNAWYKGKEKAIQDVLEKEGVVTLFYFLNGNGFSSLKKQKYPLENVRDVLRGIYSESPFVFDDSFLKKVLQKKLTWKLQLFSPKDYKLRSDTTKLKKGMYAVLNLSEWNDLWGGSVVFIDQEENHIRIPSTANTLTLIKNPKEYYVKYVNGLAKGKRGFLLGQPI